jgi:acyl carrier protein
MMTNEMQFKTIVAQYCEVKPEDMKNDMRFREDLGFSSLDFMSFLGELEDTFDVELEEEDVLKVLTIAEALEMMEKLQQEA